MKRVPDHRPAGHTARIAILSLSIVLLTACNMPCQPHTSPTLQIDTACFNYWKEVEKMIALEQEAGLVLEAEGVDHFRKLNRDRVVEQTAVGVDGYLQLIPARAASGGSLAILIVPELELVQGTGKIMDEVILDVRDAVKNRGYERFIVAARSHGLARRIYADSLPSREQVAVKKRSWRGPAEECRRKEEAK
jgi:hypothetical protein